MKKILPTLIASAAALALAAPAAQAGPALEDATSYYITTNSFINIFDDEPFSDEFYEFYLGAANTYLGTVWGKDEKVFKFSRCAGGEVRVEVDVLAHRLDAENSTVRSQIRLYEGTSCSTKDLESKITTSNRNLANSSSGVYVGSMIYNEDDGDDYAVVNVNVRGQQVKNYCNC